MKAQTGSSVWSTHPARLWRRRFAVIIVLFLAVCSIVMAGPVGTASAAPPGKVVDTSHRHTPVILVHGFQPRQVPSLSPALAFSNPLGFKIPGAWTPELVTKWNETYGGGNTWNALIKFFKEKGYNDQELIVFNYDTSQPNFDTAQKLFNVIVNVYDSFGAQKVDLVTHSMGALPARLALASLAYSKTPRVENFVSLAGPNHGTDTAKLCPYPSCRDMERNSNFLRLLAALNKNLGITDGTETPGPVHYYTFHSAEAVDSSGRSVGSCDKVVRDGVQLRGAINFELPCSPGGSSWRGLNWPFVGDHLNIVNSPGVFQEIYNLLNPN